MEGADSHFLQAWRWLPWARSQALLVQVLGPVHVHVEVPVLELDQELV